MKNFLLAIFTFSTLSSASVVSGLLHYEFNGEYDEAAGETAYKKYQCISCHGKHGERKAATFEALTNLSAAKIKAALVGYQNDKDYGGRNKFIMQRYAQRLSTQEIDNIIYFLKGNDLQEPDSADKEPTAATENNLFIK